MLLECQLFLVRTEHMLRPVARQEQGATSCNEQQPRRKFYVFLTLVLCTKAYSLTTRRILSRGSEGIRCQYDESDVRTKNLSTARHLPLHPFSAPLMPPEHLDACPTSFNLKPAPFHVSHHKLATAGRNTCASCAHSTASTVLSATRGVEALDSCGV